MASIRKRGNSYLLVVSMGYTPDGRRRNPQQKTIKPPTGLTPKQTEKWLHEQAMLFEMSCKKMNPDIDRSITLEKYTEIWLQTIAPDKLAKSTLVREKQDIERFKPYLGSYKLVVNILIYEDGKIFVDKEEYTEAEFISFLKGRDDWFICESMKQHQYSDDIYDKTVNTIRLITLRDIHTHQFKIFFAVQRIGTSATIPVDNGSRGGLVAKIDLDTGILSEARCLHNRNVYKVHPDSGASIEGAQIPNWEKIKKQMLELANKMPYMHFIAWDILIMEDGEICIIEANTSSGVNIIQLWGGQRNGELGDFYRYHGVIKK